MAQHLWRDYLVLIILLPGRSVKTSHWYRCGPPENRQHSALGMGSRVDYELALAGKDAA